MEQNKRFCPNCRKPVRDNDKFCPCCGHGLPRTASAEVTEPAEPVPAPEQIAPVPAKKKSPVKWIAITAAAVVLTAASASAAWLVFGRTAKEEPKEVPKQKPVSTSAVTKKEPEIVKEKYDPYVMTEVYCTDYAEDSDSPGEKYLGEQNVYDNNGNLTEKTTYSAGDVLYEKYNYEYDNDGNMTKETCYDWEGMVWWKEYNKYIDGRLAEDTKHYSFGFSEVSEYIFDDKGRIKEKITTNDDEQWIRSGYEYDEDGNMVKETITISDDADGKLWGTYEYEYDADGNKTKMIMSLYESNGVYNTECTYEYDENGNLAKEISYDNAGNIKSEMEYVYILLSEYLKQK